MTRVTSSDLLAKEFAETCYNDYIVTKKMYPKTWVEELQPYIDSILKYMKSNNFTEADAIHAILKRIPIERKDKKLADALTLFYKAAYCSMLSDKK